MAWVVLKQIRAGDVTHQKEKNFHENEVMYFQTDELVIYNNSLAPLHIDGEPAATDKKFIIKILPKVFKLIQP
jgi:diacylglycerol kinase family enzyme